MILYTSGTTGRPKGVVLSNRNILATAKASAEFDRLTPEDSVLAYLPMAWVGDFIFSMGQAWWVGFCVACPESPETMEHDLREIGPTYFFAPPRFFEAMLTRVMIRMEDAGALKRGMFNKFMGLARRVGPAILDGRPVGAAERAGYALGEVLVYGPLRNVLGLSRIRVGYTAGEAIGPEIFAFYRALGINLKQLYGQTEASVFITQQPDGAVRADTVGVASPGVELQDRGERRGLLPLARGVRGVLQEPGEHGGDQGCRGVGGDGGRGLHRGGDAGSSGSSTGRRTWGGWRMGRCLRPSMWKTS